MSDGPCDRKGRPGWLVRPALVGVMLLLAAGVCSIVFLAGRKEPADPTSATTRPATGPVATQPATRPAATKPSSPWKPPRFTARQAERNRMVNVIRKYGVQDQTVLDAMRAVPRHEFVPDRHDALAYADMPLPIGYGQTISQPFIVAEMTRLLRLKKHARVLEVGTGSGYQAAVLSELTPHVYTIEIIKPLAETARKRLKRLGYTVVQVRHGDGYYGWPEAAPFDGIIVTAAAGQIPPPLLNQLAPGGRMVIPVGGPLSAQMLVLVEKDQKGKIRSRTIMPVRFVPFTREVRDE